MKSPLYPDTIANADMLASLKAAQDHVKEVMGSLSKRKVQENFGSRGRMPAERYEGFMGELQNSYNNAVEVATTEQEEER